MSSIIVYYSLTGNNKTLANILSEKTNIKLIEIKELKKRNFFSYLKEIITKKLPEIEEINEDFSIFDRVIILSPIWMGVPATPCIKFLKKYNNQIKKFIFITLDGGSIDDYNKIKKYFNITIGKEPERVFELKINDIAPIESKGKPLKVMKIRVNKDILLNNYSKQIDQIVNFIK